MEEELDKLVSNLAPSKQAEVRFFLRQALQSKMSDLRKKVESMKKNERNMLRGNIQLETTCEVYAWNYALDEIINLIRNR